MILKGVIDEDFIQYKKASMVLVFPHCTFKCDKECGKQVCQNSALANTPVIECKPEDIVARYVGNQITKAIVLSGLEPLDDEEQAFSFIRLFREFSQDDIILYTGYKESEERFTKFCEFIHKNNYKNVLAKVGRFIPDSLHRFDNVLGVELASANQYGKVIS